MSEYEQEDRNDDTLARGDGQLSQYPHSGTDIMPFKGRMSLVINGMIESGLIPDENGVCIKFDFKSGRVVGRPQTKNKSRPRILMIRRTACVPRIVRPP